MSSSGDEASGYARQMLYSAWRLDIWLESKGLTYREIDAAVEAGLVQPGAMVEEVKAAVLRLPRDKRRVEFGE